MCRPPQGGRAAVFSLSVSDVPAYSSMLRGAAEVYVVDGVAERLAKVEEIGAIAVDYSQGEPEATG